jgi:hypothetical protein
VELSTLLTDELEDKIIWHLNYLYAENPRWKATAKKGMTLLERIEKLNDKEYYYLLEGLSSPARLEKELEFSYNSPLTWGNRHPHNYPGYPATAEKQAGVKMVSDKSEKKPKAVKKKATNSSTE